MEFSTSFSMVIIECGWVQSSPLYRWHKAFISHRIFLMHLSPQTRAFSHRDSHRRLICCSTLIQHHLLVPFMHLPRAPPSCTFLSLCKFTTSSHRRCVLLRMHSSHVHVNAFYHSLIMMVAFEVLTKHLVTYDH